MEELWKEFIEIAEHPYQRLREWKEKTGGKIIGHLPMYVPEEIVHASGALPVTLFGTDEAVSLANRYLQPYLCHPIRSSFDLALKGGFEILDGVIFPDICDQVQCLAGLWRLHCPATFHHNLMVPNKVNSPSAKAYLVSRLLWLKACLEEFMGKLISDEDLHQSVKVYNRNRALLDQLYSLRRASPLNFKGKHVVAAVTASMVMPKEEHSELLTKLLEGLSKEKKPADGKVKLVLSGDFCDIPSFEFLDLIEELGGAIVDDDVYVGRRYFNTPVKESPNPIESLAQRYLEDIPCPTKHNPSDGWGKFLIQLARESEAKGVVIVTLQFCEPHGFDYPYLKDELSAAGIPHLFIETERGELLAETRSKLQGFMEILQKE